MELHFIQNSVSLTCDTVGTRGLPLFIVESALAQAIASGVGSACLAVAQVRLKDRMASRMTISIDTYFCTTLSLPCPPRPCVLLEYLPLYPVLRPFLQAYWRKVGHLTIRRRRTNPKVRAPAHHCPITARMHSNHVGGSILFFIFFVAGGKKAALRSVDLLDLLQDLYRVFLRPGHLRFFLEKQEQKKRHRKIKRGGDFVLWPTLCVGMNRDFG